MAEFDQINQIDPEKITLTEATLGYDILLDGDAIGVIEGFPGMIEHLMIRGQWENMGAGRAALNEFVSLSQELGISEITTNNPVHDAMEHILKTEGFEQRSDSCGWVKEI